MICRVICFVIVVAGGLPSSKDILSFYKSIGIDFVMKDVLPKSKEIQKKDLGSIDKLQDLKEIVANFEGCDLKKFATNTVFCDGNPSSGIMLIGEAPGESEDLQGIPFCGKSGKLLDKMLAAINLDRSSVYITNTVFWRPPGNRKPTQEEVEICRPFLEHHIRIVKPKLIVLVGGTAAAGVLDVNIGISRLRGAFFYQYKNPYIKDAIPATAIFHPAYLLRQPGQKVLAWQDLQFIKKYLDENCIV